MQRFVPFCFPDRAKAPWNKAGSAPGPKPFWGDLWRDRVFRSLWQEAIFSPRSPERHSCGDRQARHHQQRRCRRQPTVFRDVSHFYRPRPPRVEISRGTAAHNSARFTLRLARRHACGRDSPGGRRLLRELGAGVTGSEVLKAGIRRWGRAIHPGRNLSAKTRIPRRGYPPAEASPGETKTWAGRRSVRCGRCSRRATRAALLAASELRALVEENGGKYFLFQAVRRIRASGAGARLGPVARLRDLMRAQLRSATCGNSEQLRLAPGGAQRRFEAKRAGISRAFAPVARTT